MNTPIQPSSTALPVLEVAGFGATVDAYAWESDPDLECQHMRLWFVSLLGSLQALKAIWARLLRGEAATLSSEALGSVQFCKLADRDLGAWRSFTSSLPGAGGHQLVLLPEAGRIGAARPDIILLPRTSDEAPVLHWRFLDRRLDLPLRMSWATWLFERACRTGEAIPLQAFGIVAYRCRPDPEALAGDLSSAIQHRQLPDDSPQF